MNTDQGGQFTVQWEATWSAQHQETPMSTPDSIDYHPTIKELPCGDRPRERLIREGATALSTAELLAIIFRVGVGGENVISLSQRLLAGYGGLAGLARAPFTDLQNEHGL